MKWLFVASVDPDYPDTPCWSQGRKLNTREGVKDFIQSWQHHRVNRGEFRLVVPGRCWEKNKHVFYVWREASPEEIGDAQ